MRKETDVEISDEIRNDIDNVIKKVLHEAPEPSADLDGPPDVPFRLARAIQAKLIEHKYKPRQVDPEEVVEIWLRHQDEQYYDGFEDDFIEVWNKVKYPLSPLKYAHMYARARFDWDRIPPKLFRSQRRMKLAAMVAAMAEFLHSRQSPESFCLPVQEVARTLGTTTNEASLVIRRLIRAGILIVEDPAIPGVCARKFRYSKWFKTG
jgi:hypothetical protein